MSLYFEASKIIRAVKERRGSVKNLIFSSHFKNKKPLYALVCECLKYQEVLATVLDRTGLLKLERCLRNDTDLAMVLLYDHLFGRRVSGKFQVVLKKHKNAIHAECERLKVKAGVTSLRQIGPNTSEQNDTCLPRYVRVNTLKTSREIVVKVFQEQGWLLVDCTKDSFREVVSCLKPKKFTLDPHIPDLFIFPASTDFHRNKLYTAGEIILQDKASCYPAYLLSPPSGSHVIDCCAAPGNKTSHLACIMHNKGKIFAFDKDHKRLTTLQNMMGKFGATCVEAKCQDFLAVNPKDSRYRDVEYILVDPSCSGTGMINRSNQNKKDESVSEEILNQLSKFQITILKHALRFPSVQKVVYSTCSVHELENEQVVEEVFTQVKDEFLIKHLEPDWTERGHGGYEYADWCLRMSHDTALTNGFFVACFERKHFNEDSDVDEQIDDAANLEIETDSSIQQIDDAANLEIETDSSIQQTDYAADLEQGSIDTVGNNADGKKARNKKKRKKLKSKHRSNDVCDSHIENVDGLSEKIDGFSEQKHSNSCKKKRKRSKERVNRSEKESIESEKIQSNSSKKKRKKLNSKQSVVEKIDGLSEQKHSNSCKKKRKRSKEGVTDSEKKSIESEKTPSNSCKKKKKKLNSEQSVVEKIDGFSEQKQSNSCKKKRKRSKERVTESSKTSIESEKTPDNSCNSKKKRKKSKERVT